MIELPFLKIMSSGIELTVSEPRLNKLIRIITLSSEDFEQLGVGVDYILLFVLICLVGLAFVQLHAFSRPPPVQRKLLPRRPALQILFKPDDISSTSHHSYSDVNVKVPDFSSAANTVTTDEASTTAASAVVVDDSSNVVPDGDVPRTVSSNHPISTDEESVAGASVRSFTPKSAKPKKPIVRPSDLPDSFAPLLSSSQMEILYEELSTDLLHATQVEATIRLRHGRHEIPLDKDDSRPQLIIDVPQQGCKVSAVASIGSDGFSTEEDLDPSKPVNSRSLPMVKHAGITFDSPLLLKNVAPTLIHFPTLFEDNVVKYTLRRIQIVRYALDLLNSISSFIENILWILESKCQIHLGKVSVTPLYKGAEKGSEDGLYCEPQWRLNLAFSGHVILFNFLPIPFVNITLPTWIIPQPHALLEYLISMQPLASANLKHEKIAEEPIALAVIGAVDTWDLKLNALATPPALSVDLTMPGGLTVAMEAMHGTDVSGGRPRGGVESGKGMVESPSNSDTLSSCTFFTDNEGNRGRFNRRHRSMKVPAPQSTPSSEIFNANNLVPWKFNLVVGGKIEDNQISVFCSNASASHDPSVAVKDVGPSFQYQEKSGSKFSISGNVVIGHPDDEAYKKAEKSGLIKRKLSSANFHSRSIEANRRSVAATILFPEKKTKKMHHHNLLKYDYNLDIGEDTSLDAVSVSIGAKHPMLKGGTIITTIIENIYAYGGLSARENSIIDMSELSRKRNVLRHLPAIDVTTGIQNIFIPEESMSFSDDGQTRCLPELLGGQIMLRVLGGFKNIPSAHVDENSLRTAGSFSHHQSATPLHVDEGIKVNLDFGIASFALNSKTKVNEFPELEIFEDQRLESTTAGSIDGSIGFHLRPQKIGSSQNKSTSKNVFNPLEAYEIDFTGSNVGVKLSEGKVELGHRRLVIPSEATFGVHILKSIVDMAFDGTTECEFNWDFQGSSPVLQSTSVGLSPEEATHEEKEQVNLLIYPLRQGRFNLNVSPVGGLTITQAATTRENKEGLYDWKFFNAIVSPDDTSAAHILKVLHDKRTMDKVLQVVKLVNKDLEKLAKYLLKQLWRAKDLFDSEKISDPGHAIPCHAMARLMSLFLCDDTSQIDEILPIIQRVVAGNGLDVIKTKELLRKNLSIYDKYSPEIDRVTRWAEVMMGNIEAPKPYVEKLSPLSLDPRFKNLFQDFPSAKEIYQGFLEKRNLPLDHAFSSMASTLAPYMSFAQVEYILESRPPKDWQPSDLRRLRYVYAVKKKVLEISESYGGISFMPQSFFVSIFVGEATRASLRAWGKKDKVQQSDSFRTEKASNESAFHVLRKLKQASSHNSIHGLSTATDDSKKLHGILSPAGRIASMEDLSSRYKTVGRARASRSSATSVNSKRTFVSQVEESFDIGDSLLGPEDVAILLQAGLTSSMRGSTVVQLNQRMLLDLMASQPRQFSVAVLCEIGSPGGQGNPRGLTSALMALLDLDQSSFTEFHRLDMHQLLESWLPGLKIPRRDDHLAGGRWASRSYYDAIYNVAESILDEAKVYTAFKGHIQRVRHNAEEDAVPTAKEITSQTDPASSRLMAQITKAKESIATADSFGSEYFNDDDEQLSRDKAIELYNKAFNECKLVLKMDKLAFHADWFKAFYRRNYDALMVKSVYENVIDDVDEVREWLWRMQNATATKASSLNESASLDDETNDENWQCYVDFKNPESYDEQQIITAIIDLLFYDEQERKVIKSDPLVRLLISNPDGNYNFTIVSAMGVITEGKHGVELKAALDRLKAKRNVDAIRSDTGTARSLEYNAGQIHHAIDEANKLNKPYGLLGYSQGCPNSLLAESLLLSGSPAQQSKLNSSKSKLVCRQLLFSAANGSMHGPATEAKIHRLIVMCESFFKYQQGYCSRAFISSVLDALTGIMDSAPFQKFVAGGGGTFLHQGSRAFWREAQHLEHVPTCVLRGVLESHTTPESLEMISNLLTKAAGSHEHDSQVHVYDAIGQPVYTKNRNAEVLKHCDMSGAIQRTHHWSPLNEEVKFVETSQDREYGTFLCAKDRHVFPWVDVNARFGFIDYEK